MSQQELQESACQDLKRQIFEGFIQNYLKYSSSVVEMRHHLRECSLVFDESNQFVGQKIILQITSVDLVV